MSPRSRRRRPDFVPSAEKLVVRDYYDFPLMEKVANRVDGAIRYFGMPGASAWDLQSWGHLCEYVGAVDFDEGTFNALRHRLSTQYGTLESRTHLGDVDKVILANYGENDEELVSRAFSNETEQFFWDFDVIYLDYYGKFLPFDRDDEHEARGGIVRNRTRAIRHLFSPLRQDAWKPWVFMLTIESNIYDRRDLRQMIDYLEDFKADATVEVRTALDFLLDDSVTQSEQAARLIHGTLNCIIATAANTADVLVSPKPTVLYRGSSGAPMLHFAYDVDRAGELSGSQKLLPLLTTPFLRVKDTAATPHFEMLDSQPRVKRKNK